MGTKETATVHWHPAASFCTSRSLISGHGIVLVAMTASVCGRLTCPASPECPGRRSASWIEGRHTMANRTRRSFLQDATAGIAGAAMMPSAAARSGRQPHLRIGSQAPTGASGWA